MINRESTPAANVLVGSGLFVVDQGQLTLLYPGVGLRRGAHRVDVNTTPMSVYLSVNGRLVARLTSTGPVDVRDDDLRPVEAEFARRVVTAFNGI